MALDGAECQPGMGRVVIQRSPARPAAAPMKLKFFEIKNYKVIDDTGPVTVDPNLTALWSGPLEADGSELTN